MPTIGNKKDKMSDSLTKIADDTHILTPQDDYLIEVIRTAASYIEKQDGEIKLHEKALKTATKLTKILEGQLSEHQLHDILESTGVNEFRQRYGLFN